MKEKSKREFLIVPNFGSKIHAIKISKTLIIFLTFFFIAGFLGYIIPFNTVTINEIEAVKNKNITEQNKKLIALVKPINRLIDNLNEEISIIEQKKNNVIEKLGVIIQPLVHSRKSKHSQINIDLLLKKINLYENQLKDFIVLILNNSDYLDSLPIRKPIRGDLIVSTYFGPQKEIFTQETKNHYGIDIITETGTPVIAPASGVVIKVEENSIWGKKITIKHNKDFSTVYAHLGSISVFSGKKVKAGEIIGTIGLSGVSSGPHLHYEILRNNVPINPLEIIMPDSTLSTVALLN